MFSVTIFAVGKLKEPWLREGFSEYRKRLSAYCDLSVVEIPEHRLPEAPSPAQIQKGLEEEGRAILDRAGKAPLVALCIEGKTLSSPDLARFLGERHIFLGCTDCGVWQDFLGYTLCLRRKRPR